MGFFDIVTSFEVIDNLSQLEGYQKVQLLEKLENTPPAQQPEKLIVELLGDDLTRQMLPGDLVRINGILYPSKKYKNATLLTQKELILEAYGLELEKTIQETIHITEEDKQKIQDRYLKGVSIKDLVLQFDQSEELIKMVLRVKMINIQ